MIQYVFVSLEIDLIIAESKLNSQYVFLRSTIQCGDKKSPFEPSNGIVEKFPGFVSFFFLLLLNYI